MNTLDDFNWKVSLFLKNLTTFKKAEKKVTKITLKLLEDVLLQVEEFVADIDIDENQNPRQPFQIDETHFEFKYLISCRLCHYPIGPSRDEYLAHVTSEGHNSLYAKHINVNGYTKAPINDEPVPVPLRSIDNKNSAEKKIQDNRSQHARDEDRSRNLTRRETPGMQYDYNERTVQNERNLSGNRSGQRDNNRGFDDHSSFNRRKSLDNGMNKRWNSNQSLNNHNSKTSNQLVEHSQTANNELARPPSTVPSVFDDDIFSFIDQQNSKQSQARPPQQSAPNSNSDQPRKSLPASGNASATSNTNDIPPYMMNSLFLNRLGKDRDERKFVPTKSVQAQPTQSFKPAQPVKNYDNKHKSLPSSRRTSSENSGEIKPVPSYHLNQLLQKKKVDKQINEVPNTKSVPMANTAQINSQKLRDILANLQRDADENTNVASTAARSDNSLNKSQSAGGSTVALNQNEIKMTNADSSTDVTTGAIPKRSKSVENLKTDNSTENNYGGNTAGRRTPPQRLSSNTQSNIELFKGFFIRNINPIVSHLLEDGERLRNHPVYPKIINDIEELLKDKYPKMQCHLFGSRVIGLGNDRSKLNIYVDLLDSFNTSRVYDVLRDAGKYVENALMSNSKWSNVKAIDKDGRLMIRVLGTYEQDNLNCSISLGICGTGATVYTSRLINALFDHQIACRQAVIWIIRWFHELPSKQMGNFNSYLITLLVIFYFQSKHELPSIKELQTKTQRVGCGENNVAFTLPKEFIVWSERFRDILIGFFEYYATFDFEENIISVFEGKPVSHNIRKQDDKKLDDSLYRFKRFIIQFQDAWKPSNLCVQDIFVHKNNVGASIASSDLYRFRAYCRESLGVLRSSAAANLLY